MKSKLHSCTIALVEETTEVTNHPDTMLFKAQDDLTNFMDPKLHTLTRFNFCPFCGRPLDWVKLENNEALGEAHPRISIVDVATQADAHARPVVHIREQANGTLLFVGDNFDLDIDK